MVFVIPRENNVIKVFCYWKVTCYFVPQKLFTIYGLAKHLWRSLLAKKLHRRCLSGSKIYICFVKFLKGLHYIFSSNLQLYWKKRLWHRRFNVNFAKILRIPTLKNIYEGLLHNIFCIITEWFEKKDGPILFCCIIIGYKEIKKEQCAQKMKFHIEDFFSKCE